jgi:protein-S-isoprenylcysteine O-methyltransferase Ste14
VAKIATWACWGVVIVTWLAGALHGVRNAHSKRQGLPASIWAIGAVVGAILVVHFAWNDATCVRVHWWWLWLPGLVLLVVSTAFTIWARLSLGRMWSASPNMLQAHHELRTNGPYAITRHPIYTGLLGMLLCTALLNGLGASLAILIVGTVFLVTRIPIEERLMKDTFPDDYTRYRERVPCLVPGLRLHRRAH